MTAFSNPAFCSSSTALIVGAIAKTSRPAPTSVRRSSRRVAVFPCSVSAAPLMLTAGSRQSQHRFDGALSVQAEAGRRRENPVMAEGFERTETRSIAAIIRRSLSRLSSVAISRWLRRTRPDCFLHR